MKTPRLLGLLSLIAAASALPGCNSTQSVPAAPAAAAAPLGPVDPSPTVYGVADVDQKPVARRRAPPRYPVNLRRSGVQGDAVVEFVVYPDGTVRDVAEVRSTSPAFALAAMEAVSQWAFTPAQLNGKVVKCRMQVPILFRLGK